MNTQEKKTYSYYAFISYSRKDEKWAKWLQQKLETYRIPSKLRKQDLNIPQKLYPVFRDKTDLTGGKLLEVLHEELDQSQYLIVICSPNSAGSPWVDKEIRHFVEQGRDSYIIPFIVDGEPMADDPAQECYPESLRSGSESEILGISVKELGRGKAFLRVVAALLHLKFDQVVMRDRRRRMKQWAAASAACLCLLIGVLAGVWHYMPHSAYYADIVYCYEVPQGVHPLTRAERMGCEQYYRIVKLKGKVVRLEVLNSLGNLVEIPAASAEESYASIDFFYEGSRLSRVEQRGASGVVRLVGAYSSNLKAVDFQKPDSGQAFALSTGQGGLGMSFDWTTTTKSEVTRCINSYDENGYLIETRYMRDNRNTPVADNNGNYGLRYEREASGQTKSVTGLDENGNPHNSRYGYAMYIYTYDENGRNIAMEYFDADGQKARNEFGYCRTEFVLDKFGNVLSYKYFDEQNALCNRKDGYAQTEIQRTSQGFIAEMRALDADGEPVCSKTDGTHAYRCFYDENGYIGRVEYFDTEMRPTYHSSGYFRIEGDDGSGDRPAGKFYFGVDGTPVCEKNSGCFGMLNEWIDELLYRTTYVDAGYRPMMSRYGYASFEHSYNSDGNLIKEAYFDVDGRPMRSKNNFASVEYEYDEMGKLIRKVYKDEQKERCIRTGGYAECVFAYDERGNLVSEKYYDAEENPVVTSGGYHEIRREYDDHGNEIRTECRKVDGNLMTNYNTSSCATVERRYDEYGNILEISYYDADGQPEQVVGISRIFMEYDARGNTVRVVESPWGGDEEVDNPFTRITVLEHDDRDNLIRCAFFHTDGQPYPDANNDAAYLVAYDNQDRPICYEYFDADGNQTSATEFAYNERHQTIRELYYFPGAEPGSMELAYQYWYSYDDAGTSERLEYRDADGNLTMCDGNYAVRERGYNMTGEVIEEAFYDENGNLCLYLDDYAILRLEYDALGNKTREMYYDQNEKLFAVNEFSYNTKGWRLSVAYMDGEGNLREVKNTSSRIEYQYDANGWLISRTEYDLEGNAHAVTADLVSIAEVIAGGQAALAGIQAGDLLLKYGDWELFDYANVDEAGDSFQKVAGETRDKGKILVTGRENKDKTAVEFYAIHLGPGTADIRIVDDPRSFEWIEYVYTQYENWKEENGW